MVQGTISVGSKIFHGKINVDSISSVIGEPVARAYEVDTTRL
jgi:hypothetical protein